MNKKETKVITNQTQMDIAEEELKENLQENE